MLHRRLTVSGLSQWHIFSRQQFTPVITPGPSHHQDGPLHYTLPVPLPRYLFIIQSHGPKSRLCINTLGTLMVTRLVHLILILPFSEVKLLMLYAVRNTLLRFFTWKVNSYSSSQLRCHFLWEIFTVILCPLFFSLTICPTTPQLSPLSPLRPLYICPELNVWICLHSLSTYHLRLSFSKDVVFNPQSWPVPVSHVHLIITWMNMV